MSSKKMKTKKKKYKFDLSYEECKRIIESIDGIVVVDAEGRIRYFSEDVIKGIENVNRVPIPDDYINKFIEDIHPASKITNVLKSGEENKYHIYFWAGEVTAACIKPIYDGKSMIGAIDYDYFATTTEIKSFIDKIQELREKGLIHLPEDLDESDQEINQGENKYSISNIIGDSTKISELKKQIYDTAGAASTVLVTGETGSGKELVAHAIHNLSSRRMEPFIEVNCAAIPETLFESELFGYESGSFTGADVKGRAGKFEQANHGTILLDEIDQIPYHIQPKLLRVLQEREIDRIGSKNIPVNVRVIATTNKDLKALIKEQKFRVDLFYRLNVVNLITPPLRERKEDIPLLVYSQMQTLNMRLNRNVEKISDETLRLFSQYDWPGNVRELFNIMERAMNNCDGRILEEKHLGDFLLDILKEDTDSLQIDSINPLEEIRDNAERIAIEKTLEANDYNKSKTAEFLKISRPTLYYKMKQYGIENKSSNM